MGNKSDIDVNEEFAGLRRAAIGNAALAPLPGETIAEWWVRFEEQQKKQWDPEDSELYEVLEVVGAVCRHLTEMYNVALESDGEMPRFYPRNRRLLH